MRNVRLVLLAGLLAGALAFLGYISGLKEGGPASEAIPTAPALASGIVPVEFTDSAQCKSCHPDIYEEWSKDEHSNSLAEDIYKRLSDDYKMVECISCHAPQPMLEAGLDMVARTREFNRMSGVDCLSCHLKAGRAHGKGAAAGPCAGAPVPEMGTSKACFPCHSTHNLFVEYEASEEAKKGKTCQDCHMEKVIRPVAVGSPARETRRHRFLGGHDLATLRKALALELAVEGNDVYLTVTNVGGSHGVPGEINNRVMQCSVTVTEADGRKSDVLVVQFQAPPRLLRGRFPSTQIMQGEPRRARLPLGTPRGRISARLIYKLEPDIPDSAATVVAEKSIDY